MTLIHSVQGCSIRSAMRIATAFFGDLEIFMDRGVLVTRIVVWKIAKDAVAEDFEVIVCLNAYQNLQCSRQVVRYVGLLPE